MDDKMVPMACKINVEDKEFEYIILKICRFF